MRVASSSFSDSLIQQLNTISQRQVRLQNQVATGQRIKLPEDDPAAMHRVMNLSSEQSRIAQYQSNVTSLSNLAQTNYGAIQSLVKISDRAGEIATLADGTKSPDELKSYATEINQLIQQGVQTMNQKFQGDYVLGGTESTKPPYAVTLDSDGNVTGVTYQGNSNVRETEIGDGALFTVQAVGENTSGSGPRGMITDTRSGADFFNHLISLRENLQTGNTQAIANTDRANLTNDENNLAYHLGTNGAQQARLDAAKQLATSQNQSIEGLVSNEADADMAQSMVKLTQTNTAYQAALQSAGTLLNLSLLDYLR